MKPFSTIGLIILALGLGASSPVLAGDALIEGAKECTKYLPRYERQYAIPTHLLSAIASTESGRYHEGLKLKLPWPWTINANGKGYYYNSKSEAIAAAHKFRAQGIKSIDVGCMQVNLYHHPDAFSSLDKAFEPQTNIAYAAGFLRTLYNDEGTWKKAASDYHSKTPKLGGEYVGIVYDSWFTIIQRLREARMAVPASSVVALNELKNPSALSPSAGKVVRVADNVTQPSSQPLASHTRPHMYQIEVKDAKTSDLTASRENNVVVYRPEIVTAQASAPEPKIIPVNAPTSQPRKSGPNFIFNN